MNLNRKIIRINWIYGKIVSVSRNLQLSDFLYSDSLLRCKIQGINQLQIKKWDGQGGSMRQLLNPRVWLAVQLVWTRLLVKQLLHRLFLAHLLSQLTHPLEAARNALPVRLLQLWLQGAAVWQVLREVLAVENVLVRTAFQKGSCVCARTMGEDVENVTTRTVGIYMSVKGGLRGKIRPTFLYHLSLLNSRLPSEIAK